MALTLASATLSVQSPPLSPVNDPMVVPLPSAVMHTPRRLLPAGVTVGAEIVVPPADV
jgi:hypothetical protein